MGCHRLFKCVIKYSNQCYFQWYVGVWKPVFDLPNSVSYPLVHFERNPLLGSWSLAIIHEIYQIRLPVVSIDLLYYLRCICNRADSNYRWFRRFRYHNYEYVHCHDSLLQPHFAYPSTLGKLHDNGQRDLNGVHLVRKWSRWYCHGWLLACYS